MSIIELLQKIPANTRAWIYGAYSVVGFLLGLFEITGMPFGWDQAQAWQIYAYVGVAIGVAASANANGVKAISAPPNE